jgi:hypothetical protein
LPPEWSLLRGSGPSIFVARAGLKRYIPGIATFNGRGFLWANIDKIHDFYLNSLPQGNDVLDVRTTGQLIQTSRPEVYVMDNGVKRHVVSSVLFTNCGYTWTSIARLGSEIDAIPSGPPLTAAPCPTLNAPDGTLLRGSAGAIYAADDGTLRHVVSASVMNACTYQWGDVDPLHDALLATAPKGQALTAPPCP